MNMGFSLLQNSAALLRLTSTEQQEGWKLIQPCCRLRKLLELLSFVVRDPKSSEPTLLQWWQHAQARGNF